MKNLEVFAKRFASAVFFVGGFTLVCVVMLTFFCIEIISMSKAMWICSIFWIIIALAGWVDKDRSSEWYIFCKIYFTLAAIISIAGIYIPALAIFAVLVDIFILALITVTLILMFE